VTSKARSGFLPDRTVHLHATNLCNLACLHCYSSSSPHTNEALGFEALATALVRLREQGYEVLSLSGGEPLLYPRFADLNRHARTLGMRIVAISNGYRVRPQYDELLATLDGVAISFDGLGEHHDRMRARRGAFDVAIGALRHLRQLGMPAAAAYTVTRDSLRDTAEFAELVHEHAVRALQLRPLVMAGRADQECGALALSEADRQRLFLIGASLRAAYADTMAVHTDLAHSQAIADSRDAYAALLDDGHRDAPLAELVNPLVILPDGRLMPYTYDFPSSHQLGTLADLAPRGLETIRRERVGRLRALVQQAFASLDGRDEFVDWFAYCRDSVPSAS
jgi:MoaA/NifB/PqqE/SkfB family radical SAM enzyme